MKYEIQVAGIIGVIGVMFMTNAGSAMPQSLLDQKIAWVDSRLQEQNAFNSLKQAAPGSCVLIYTSKLSSDEDDKIYYIEKFNLADIEEIDPSNANNPTLFLYTTGRHGLVHSLQRREKDEKRQELFYTDFVYFKFESQQIRDLATTKFQTAVAGCKR